MDFLLGPLSALITAASLVATSPGGISSLPEVDMETSRAMARPGFIAHISDRSGTSLGSVFREGSISTPIEKLPAEFLEAVIAIEDRRFLQHRGIDPKGLASAAMSQFGPSPRGGSSIDQQMAKNAWIGPEVSLRRKIPEALLALRARQVLGGRGVMQLYLETAWFGRGVTGAGGAAMAWFGRDWSELSLGEMAYLAGLLKGPGFYDLQRHPERAARRRDQVLQAMLREGFITEADMRSAMEAPLVPAERIARVQGQESRWAMSAAQPILGRMIDEQVSGSALLHDVEITLSIDQTWQRMAQDALQNIVRPLSREEPFASVSAGKMTEIRALQHDSPVLREIAREMLDPVLPWDSTSQAGLLLDQREGIWRILIENGTVLDEELRFPEGFRPSPGDIVAVRISENGLRAEGRRAIDGAVVIMDPRTGEILASIGGAFPDHTGFDRTRAIRQPGSAIKTFLYLAAFEHGYTPEMWVSDTERDFITEDGVIWRPRNYGRTQAGTVTLRAAFEQSSNLAAAHLMDALGSDAMARIAESAGVYPSGMRQHMTAALGTIETSLLDLAQGHATIVNGGAIRQRNAIHEMSIGGQPLIANGIRIGEGRMGAGPIARRSSIEDVLSILHGVTQRGTASVAFRGHPVTIAGKTGTTQGYRDAWFVGVTPHLAIGVWIGRDDNLPMQGQVSGGRHAAPVAAAILRQAFQKDLIDGNGFLRGSQDSSVTWPPARGASSLPSASTVMTAPQAGSWTEPPAQAPSGNFQGDVIDPFWGQPMRQLQPAPQNDTRFQPVNRNDDLRRNSW